MFPKLGRSVFPSVCLCALKKHVVTSSLFYYSELSNDSLITLSDLLLVNIAFSLLVVRVTANKYLFWLILLTPCEQLTDITFWSSSCKSIFTLMKTMVWLYVKERWRHHEGWLHLLYNGITLLFLDFFQAFLLLSNGFLKTEVNTFGWSAKLSAKSSELVWQTAFINYMGATQGHRWLLISAS